MSSERTQALYAGTAIGLELAIEVLEFDASLESFDPKLTLDRLRRNVAHARKRASDLDVAPVRAEIR